MKPKPRTIQFLLPTASPGEIEMVYRELLGVIDMHQFIHPENGWCAKTNDEHPAKFKKCGACYTEEQHQKLANLFGKEG